MSTSSNTCRIALAGPEDAAAVAALYRLAASSPGSAWCEEYPTASEAENDAARGALYCLWGEDGSLWGAATAGDPDEDARDLPCWDPSAQNPCELCRVGIRPDLQGKGLAKQLVSYVLEDVKRRGRDSVRLLVSPENPAASALYPKLGFVLVGSCRLYDTDWHCEELRL